MSVKVVRVASKHLAVEPFGGASSLLLLRPFLGGVFGRGTAARIKEAYTYLSWEYDQRHGDKVFHLQCVNWESAQGIWGQSS